MSKQENDNVDDQEDNFGLPDIDYKPLNRTTEPAHQTEYVEHHSETTVNTSTVEEEVVIEANIEPEQSSYLPEEFDETEKSNSPVMVSLIIGGLILGAILLTYLFIYKPKADKAKQEAIEKEKVLATKKKITQDSLTRVQEEAQKLLDAKRLQDVKPAIGVIETLTNRTQKYYVVLTSNIDDDLIMDYAKKLSAKGISSKIIPPFGKTKYFRLVISDEDTFAKAQANADAAKAEYGDALWVIKY
jgi:hypothetical protein